MRPVTTTDKERRKTLSVRQRTPFCQFLISWRANSGELFYVNGPVWVRDWERSYRGHAEVEDHRRELRRRLV
jgi:hypothetical protein